MSNEQKLQILLVGIPILSLLGTWMSLRTYTRLVRRTRQVMIFQQQKADSGQEVKSP